ncbi:MAG: dephospho-CoA kinase [Gammaproteobacteria bacterium]|nr:dephospho-CoA kinase [Gammaproteobacteria bacterium]
MDTRRTDPTRRLPRDWPVYRVGLTGGIASGKSTVAGMFAALGVPVIDTDVIARDVVAPGTPGLSAVVAAFGPEVLLPDGALDRRRLRSLVFDEPGRRQELESILHPRILERMEALCAAAGGPYQLLVIPLLLESGLEDRVDRVLVVDCSESVQRERLMARDGESTAAAGRILSAQLDRQARLAGADDVVTNTGTRDDLERRVQELHTEYLQSAAGATPQGTSKGGVKGAG